VKETLSSSASVDEPASRRFALAVFLGSAALLNLEILQTRIFSVLLWHHLTYLVVTFTMLGFAAGGTLMSVFPGWLDRNPPRFLAWTSTLFGLTTLAGYQILARTRLDTLELLQNRAQYLYVFVYYLYLVVPYVFAGMMVVGALKKAGRHTGWIYGANLAGSAAGCLLFANLLTPLGGERAIFLAVAIVCLAGALFARSFSSSSSSDRASRPLPASSDRATAPLRQAGGGASVVPSLALAALVLAALPFAPRLLPVEAAPSKPMIELMNDALAHGKKARIETTRWDPLCRLDVVDFGDGPSSTRRVFQDADAPTEILPKDQPFDFNSVYCFPYRICTKNPEVLVIGVGGGQDLRQAVWNQARSVTGVEINRTTAGLMQNEYREFAGDPYRMPAVEVIETEGRSFIRRSQAIFDLIQMTGTDTYAALASGSYVMSESYLYTVDAFLDYFERLKPGGMVSVLRFRFFPPRESLRLVSIAVEALRRRGAEHPERHVIVLDKVHEVEMPEQPGVRQKFAYAAMLFKESPFTEEQIQAARDYVEHHPQKQIYSIAYAPGEPVHNEFGEFLRAVDEGPDAARRFMDSYPYRISPVDDDSPFFFKYHRWSSLFEKTRAADYLGVIGRDPIGLFLLLTALVESTLLVALLVILPLLLSGRARLPSTSRVAVLIYFFGLGVGFMFLEIAAMQRLVLYLGHPTRSITVVLFSVLLFSGAGSCVAGRLRPLRCARVALILIAAIVALYALFLPAILSRTLGLSTVMRIALSTLILGIPSFFMGMPFPSGLSCLRGPHQPFLPWAFAINGGASVVASVGAILLAMSASFTLVFWLAAASYLVAFLAVGGLPVPEPNTAPAPASATLAR